MGLCVPFGCVLVRVPVPVLNAGHATSATVSKKGPVKLNLIYMYRAHVAMRYNKLYAIRNCTQRESSSPTHTQFSLKPRTSAVLFGLLAMEARTKQGECGALLANG
jgi:hypothetical protein